MSGLWEYPDSQAEPGALAKGVEGGAEVQRVDERGVREQSGARYDESRAG